MPMSKTLKQKIQLSYILSFMMYLTLIYSLSILLSLFYFSSLYVRWIPFKYIIKQ